MANTTDAWKTAADYWVKSVEAEKARRAAILASYPEGATICQDDYEWATMTGEYSGDNGRCWNVEPDGTVWSERFC